MLIYTESCDLGQWSTLSFWKIQWKTLVFFVFGMRKNPTGIIEISINFIFFNWMIGRINIHFVGRIVLRSKRGSLSWTMRPVRLWGRLFMRTRRIMGRLRSIDDLGVSRRFTELASFIRAWRFWKWCPCWPLGARRSRWWRLMIEFLRIEVK